MDFGWFPRGHFEGFTELYMKEIDSAFQIAVPLWKRGKAGIIFKLIARWNVEDEFSFWGFLHPGYGTVRLSQNIGEELPLYVV